MTRPFYVRAWGDGIAKDFSDNLFIKIASDLVIIRTFFLITGKPKFKSETIERLIFSFLYESCTNDSFFNFWSISSNDIKNNFFPDFLYNVIVTKGS